VLAAVEQHHGQAVAVFARQRSVIGDVDLGPAEAGLAGHPVEIGARGGAQMAIPCSQKRQPVHPAPSMDQKIAQLVRHPPSFLDHY
jgi:hypothetical protein